MKDCLNCTNLKRGSIYLITEDGRCRDCGRQIITMRTQPKPVPIAWKLPVQSEGSVRKVSLNRIVV